MYKWFILAGTILIVSGYFLDTWWLLLVGVGLQLTVPLVIFFAKPKKTMAEGIIEELRDESV